MSRKRGTLWQITHNKDYKVTSFCSQLLLFPSASVPVAGHPQDQPCTDTHGARRRCRSAVGGHFDIGRESGIARLYSQLWPPVADSGLAGKCYRRRRIPCPVRSHLEKQYQNDEGLEHLFVCYSLSWSCWNLNEHSLPSLNIESANEIILDDCLTDPQYRSIPYALVLLWLTFSGTRWK